jgi:hypothetical protein
MPNHVKQELSYYNIMNTSSKMLSVIANKDENITQNHIITVSGKIKRLLTIKQ